MNLTTILIFTLVVSVTGSLCGDWCGDRNTDTNVICKTVCVDTTPLTAKIENLETYKADIAGAMKLLTMGREEYRTTAEQRQRGLQTKLETCEDELAEERVLCDQSTTELDLQHCQEALVQMMAVESELYHCRQDVENCTRTSLAVSNSTTSLVISPPTRPNVWRFLWLVTFMVIGTTSMTTLVM
jgi:hypothetical protein